MSFRADQTNIETKHPEGHVSQEDFAQEFCCATADSILTHHFSGALDSYEYRYISNIATQAWGGSVKHMKLLGDCYYAGSRNLCQDIKLAVPWYMRAAKLGSKRAMARLGYAYNPDTGRCTPDKCYRDDIDASIYWYKRASDYSSLQCIGFLYDCYLQQYQEAKIWYEAAIKEFRYSHTRDWYAHNSLCQLLVTNKGRHFSEAEARRGFELGLEAAQNGCFPAIENIAMFYERGWGTDCDLVRAVEFWIRAHNSGSQMGRVCLGILLARNMIARVWEDVHMLPIHNDYMVKIGAVGTCPDTNIPTFYIPPSYNDIRPRTWKDWFKLALEKGCEEGITYKDDIIHQKLLAKRGDVPSMIFLSAVLVYGFLEIPQDIPTALRYIKQCEHDSFVKSLGQQIHIVRSTIFYWHDVSDDVCDVITAYFMDLDLYCDDIYYAAEMLSGLRRCEETDFEISMQF